MLAWIKAVAPAVQNLNDTIGADDTTWVKAVAPAAQAASDALIGDADAWVNTMAPAAQTLGNSLAGDVATWINTVTPAAQSLNNSYATDAQAATGANASALASFAATVAAGLSAWSPSSGNFTLSSDASSTSGSDPSAITLDRLEVVDSGSSSSGGSTSSPAQSPPGFGETGGSGQVVQSRNDPTVWPAPGGGSSTSGQGVTSSPTQTGLGADVDKLAAMSPTMQAMLSTARKKGYTIRYGTPGAGSSTTRDLNLITIDPKLATQDKVATLAHELGHATTPPDPNISGKGLSYGEYVKQNVAKDLRNEGAATYANAAAREEIAANKGPTIPILGSQSAKYQQIYQQYKNNKTTAIDKMGQLYGSGETTSTSNSKLTYDQHYRAQYTRQKWQADNKVQQSGGRGFFQRMFGR